MTIAPGTRFDRYEILSVLGQGGMGEVYLALDTRLKRKVALKLLPAAVTQNADRVRRFEHEALAASALNHPNIITIYEIGVAGGTHFIATELIEGQTLRQWMAGGKRNLGEALDVAAQVADALAEAHAAGIVHRDVKPANIMRRSSGLVKVLDFGLAKLTEASSSPTDTAAPTAAAGLSTETGQVMGTPRYMSPEQARGWKLDGRSDIFSLGVVLYEMIADRSPFEGATAAEVMAAILDSKPPKLARYSHDVPDALEWIVAKALQKDREERYQAAKDLALDLKGLKRRLEVEAEAEQARGEGASGITPQREGTSRADRPADTTSSATIVWGEIKRHRRGVAGTAAALVLAALAALWYFTRPPALTDKDTVLLTDFTNTTGDPVFDGGTLKQGLAVQLQQSPFLSLVSDTAVQQTLRLMQRPPDERLTREIAREICQRRGVKALIAGSIAKFDRNYSITLEAINSQTGDTIALAQVEAAGKDLVLKALSQAATKLRGKLGEGLSSIQKFDAPLELTTSSLAALNAYSLAQEQYAKGRYFDAIPLLKHAVELDPNFAYAYVSLGVMYNNVRQFQLSRESFERAAALHDHVSESERLRIAYFTAQTPQQGIDALELLKRTYPRSFTAANNLSFSYFNLGQFETAAADAQEAIRLDPTIISGYENLGWALIGLNRFAEAKEAFGRAIQQQLDDTRIRSGLYAIAAIDGDAAAMSQQLAWAKGRPDEYAAVAWEASSAALAGRWKQANELSRRAIDLAASSDAKGPAAQYAAEQALRLAAWSDRPEVNAPERGTLKHQLTNLAAESLALQRAPLMRVTLALAVSGESSQAQAIVDGLSPSANWPANPWVATIKGELALQLGHAGQAIDLLEAAKRYEPATEFWTPYVRGRAYLKLKQGAEAAAEFQRILDHRGHAPMSTLYPLAKLYLARALAQTGDSVRSRQEYQEFLTLWKDADTDLPVLVEAKAEFARLK